MTEPGTMSIQCCTSRMSGRTGGISSGNTSLNSSRSGCTSGGGPPKGVFCSATTRVYKRGGLVCLVNSMKADLVRTTAFVPVSRASKGASIILTPSFRKE
ncbi:hypothetical protein HanRHA438_Chr09g0413461 [Helianthus annuus]|nr:hypothetical protein HanRHA438_Chr09g0413461 [Helianthus annuus]